MKRKCELRRSGNRNLLSFLLGTLCVMALYGQVAEANNISFNELPADARMAISKAISDDLPDAYGIRARRGFRGRDR
ncbi:hypothetical protein DENIS_4944 [Desulfonema ishimotonii]|uniref:Uncharacterized protein n=1 Tax=Desulfonema ishimotonii TaxID=45657 RepID=A0A401G403_9BACT|nr:hypothetical protein [Desulfonema ishimotonii]GBC63944.1 hypothetical protein DENIS_4944 [Desulfonema ishimotonii]